MNGQKSLWVTLIKDVGFPIVIALILLFQIMPRLDKMDSSLVGLVKGFESIAETQKRLTNIQERYLEFIIDQTRERKK
jgi:hypothetical protein